MGSGHCTDQKWPNFDGFGGLGARWYKNFQFLLQKAHPCPNPRRLSHFAWRSVEGSDPQGSHTHTTVLRLCGICPGQPGWAGTRRNIHPLHSSWSSIIPIPRGLAEKKVVSHRASHWNHVSPLTQGCTVVRLWSSQLNISICSKITVQKWVHILVVI